MYACSKLSTSKEYWGGKSKILFEWIYDTETIF